MPPSAPGRRDAQSPVRQKPNPQATKHEEADERGPHRGFLSAIHNRRQIVYRHAVVAAVEVWVASSGCCRVLSRASEGQGCHTQYPLRAGEEIYRQGRGWVNRSGVRVQIVWTCLGYHCRGLSREQRVCCSAWVRARCEANGGGDCMDLGPTGVGSDRGWRGIVHKEHTKQLHSKNSAQFYVVRPIHPAPAIPACHKRPFACIWPLNGRTAKNRAKPSPPPRPPLPLNTQFKSRQKEIDAPASAASATKSCLF
jgi:hypothetical protein